VAVGYKVPLDRQFITAISGKQAFARRRFCATVSKVNVSVTLFGHYQLGTRHVSAHWNQVCLDHRDEFSSIGRCAKGTFNVLLDAPYVPPGEEQYRQKARERGKTTEGRYRDGNHISPRVRVVEVNGHRVQAWIYRGGHGDQPVIELISEKELAPFLQVKKGDRLIVVLEEVPEGTPGMPKAPPLTPGKKALSLYEQKGIYDSVGDVVKAEIVRHMCQIVIDWSGNKVNAGSGVGLKIGPSYFILTAAHVLEKSTLQSVWIYHGMGRVDDRVVPIHMGRKGGKGSTLDVGFIEIAPTDVAKLGLGFLDISRLSNDPAAAWDNLVMVSGFPGETIDRVRDGIHAKGLVYITVLQHEWEWQKDADPNLEIEVDYPKQVQEIDRAAPTRLPDAPGLSGGGLWESNPGPLGEIWGGHKVRLLGINTVWDRHGRWLRANRVANHLKLIASDYPHLRDHLAGWI
jgi:hypothetical protein